MTDVFRPHDAPYVTVVGTLVAQDSTGDVPSATVDKFRRDLAALAELHRLTWHGRVSEAR